MGKKVDRYHYFVSYTCQGRHGEPGVGRLEIIVDHKISRFDTIKSIEKYITENSNVKNVTLLNYILLGRY